jgi:hypothetical protein
VVGELVHARGRDKGGQTLDEDDPDLNHWLRVYRDNGRPPRDLPQPSRAEEELEEELEGDSDAD